MKEKKEKMLLSVSIVIRLKIVSRLLSDRTMARTVYYHCKAMFQFFLTNNIICVRIVGIPDVGDITSNVDEALQ